MLNPDRTGVVGRVRYYDIGPLDGPTILYVHGFNIASESFALVVDRLRPLGVRQVLVDLRGHGASGPCPPELLNIDDAADDFINVLTHLAVTGPVIVVGHSLGGPVSLSLMRRHPDAFQWAGSVQISSAVEPFTVHGLPQMLAGPLGRLLEYVVRFTPHFAEGMRRGITRTIAPVLAMGFYFRPVPLSVIRLHADMIQNTPLSTYRGFFDDLLTHSEVGAAEVLEGMPGYILVGDRDRVTPVSQSFRLAAMWPSAYLQVLPGSGHMPPLDAPGAVAAAIERLLDVVATQPRSPGRSPRPSGPA